VPLIAFQKKAYFPNIALQDVEAVESHLQHWVKFAQDLNSRKLFVKLVYYEIDILFNK